MKFHNIARAIPRPIGKFEEHPFSAFLYCFSKYEEIHSIREERTSSRVKNFTYYEK
jgi:hypothetical protein